MAKNFSFEKALERCVQDDTPLIEQRGSRYVITQNGFLTVTAMLIEEGFLDEAKVGDELPDNFVPNQLWAGVVGSHLKEAADKFLSSMKGLEDQLTPKGESIVALVALYACVTEREAKKAMPRVRRRRPAAN